MPRKKKVAEHELFNFDNYSEETPKPARKRKKKTVEPKTTIENKTIEEPIVKPTIKSTKETFIEELQLETDTTDETIPTTRTNASPRQRIKNYINGRGY